MKLKYLIRFDLIAFEKAHAILKYYQIINSKKLRKKNHLNSALVKEIAIESANCTNSFPVATAHFNKCIASDSALCESFGSHLYSLL